MVDATLVLGDRAHPTGAHAYVRIADEGHRYVNQAAATALFGVVTSWPCR
jgi:hypothetical protein